MRALRVAEVVAALAAVPAASAQSLLYRSPNLGGSWVAPPGVVQFNLVHRFNVSPAPSRATTNFPTFTIAAGARSNLGFGYRFATRSQVPGGASTNESEVFARWRIRGRPEGSEGLSLAITPAYNFKAQSADGELSATYAHGPVTVLGAVRALGSAYGGTTQSAVGGGAVFRMSRYVALAGDYAQLLGGDTTAAWSLGLHLQIPGSPHTFALHVGNVASTTLQGASRGLRIGAVKRLYGFEFTIPLHVSRFAAWFHPGRASGPTLGESGPAAAEIEVTALRYPGDTTRIAVGEVVRWTNRDPLDHTVTFESDRARSGTLPSQGSYAVRFDRPGTYAYHCTPHPFMRGVIVVR